MAQDPAKEVLRTKDKESILRLLNAMCVTVARDIDVFTHAQKRHKQIREGLALPHGGEDGFLKRRLDKMEAMLKMLMLLKANITLLTRSPL